MKICKQLCHGKHATHSVHCSENIKVDPSPKQQAFFEKFREEGRQQVAAQCYVECIKIHGAPSPCSEAIRIKYNLKISQ